MQIRSDSLPVKTQEIASQLLDGPAHELLKSEQINEDITGPKVVYQPTELRHAHHTLSISRRSYGLGRTAVHLCDAMHAPEYGSLYDGPSSDEIKLVFSRAGKLKKIVDVPRGYDALWGADTIMDHVLPSRRARRQRILASKTSRIFSQIKF